MQVKQGLDRITFCKSILPKCFGYESAESGIPPNLGIMWLWAIPCAQYAAKCMTYNKILRCNKSIRNVRAAWFAAHPPPSCYAPEPPTGQHQRPSFCLFKLWPVSP